MFIFLKKTFHRYLLDYEIEKHSYLYTGAILDVGAGGKRYNNLCSGEVTSIDIDPKEGVSFGDITNIPFDDESFDSVLCIEVLEYVAEYKKGISEMARVLKKNGQALISMPFFYRDHGDVVRLTKKEFQQTLEMHFSSVSILTFGNRWTAYWDGIRYTIYHKKYTPIKVFLFLLYIPVLAYIYTKKNRTDDFYTGMIAVVKK